uniref:Anoctamin 10a n=1 Tax=Cyprinodon variegatus TaxID=28743 RepID=A0A3Q2DVZ1_CYPVA
MPFSEFTLMTYSSAFSPLVVLELLPDTKQEAITWLLGRIREPQETGGAGLLVEQLGPGLGAVEKENPNLFLVGASRERLLSGAEDVGLFKEYSDGSMRGFTCSNKQHFKDFQDGFLSMAECQHIIKHELDTLRAKDETHVPGYSHAKLYPGKSISECPPGLRFLSLSRKHQTHAALLALIGG